MEAAQPILLQYGVLGVAVLVLGAVVRVLFKEKDEAHKLDRERADRNEAEVRRLNDLIAEKVLPVLGDATRSVSDATQLVPVLAEVLRELRRGDRQ